jgi:hypothetical protein
LGAAVVAQTWSISIEFDRGTQEIRKYEQGTVRLIISIFLQAQDFQSFGVCAKWPPYKLPSWNSLKVPNWWLMDFGLMTSLNFVAFQRKFLCAYA